MAQSYSNYYIHPNPKGQRLDDDGLVNWPQDWKLRPTPFAIVCLGGFLNRRWKGQIGGNFVIILCSWLVHKSYTKHCFLEIGFFKTVLICSSGFSWSNFKSALQRNTANCWYKMNKKCLISFFLLLLKICLGENDY